MTKVLGFLAVVLIVGLLFTYCEGRKHFNKEGEGRHEKGGHWGGGWKGDGDRGHGKGGEHGGDREHAGGKGGEHGGEHGPAKGGDRHDWKGHDGKGGEHGGWNHDGGKEGHHEGWKHRGHFRYMHANLSMHFVDDSLPPNVYVVLSDKGIEIKAAYERMGNTTALTKVGLRVADKSIVVSTNGNMAIDGVESTIANFNSLEFDNGEMKRKHGGLITRFGVYRIFMRAHTTTDADNSSSEDTESTRREWEKNMVPHIGMHIGVEKTAKVSPGGFIGARMAVDPTQYTTPEAI